MIDGHDHIPTTPDPIPTPAKTIVTAPAPILVWFRRDLRLADNPALAWAAAQGPPLIAAYVLDDETLGPWRLGAASRWWLKGSLERLAESLGAHGVSLILRRGNASRVIPDLVKASGARAVVWNRCYEPAVMERDTVIKAAFRDGGIDVHSFNASLLHEPWTVTTKAGGSYKVYGRFRDACLAKGEPPPPAGKPATLTPWRGDLAGDALVDWCLRTTSPDWAEGLRETWSPGEDGAHERFDDFIDVATGYAADRDFPGIAATSGLSPHLHFGEIGPRQIWHAALARLPDDSARRVFFNELLWREFAAHVLHDQPDLPEVPMNGRFADFPWREDGAGLAAWQRGQTGYPLVDAGMRELWHTGIMHNRVRMVVASFLVKHLMQPWQTGEAWFWDTLVDADLASNAFNWQWVAGCGADAAPYFRIFNPVAQGQRFDANGTYVRRWVPELAALPDKLLHTPWLAPAIDLAAAGVVLGKTYPHPIVDHKMARERALAAFKALPRP